MIHPHFGLVRMLLRSGSLIPFKTVPQLFYCGLPKFTTEVTPIEHRWEAGYLQSPGSEVSDDLVTRRVWRLLRLRSKRSQRPLTFTAVRTFSEYTVTRFVPSGDRYCRLWRSRKTGFETRQFAGKNRGRKWYTRMTTNMQQQCFARV